MYRRQPNQYLKTSTSGFLVFMKLLEVFVSIFLAVIVFINKDQLMEQIRQTMFWQNVFGLGNAYRSYLNIATGIFIGNVVLLVLDGVASLFLRLIKKGADVVAFCHIVRCLFMSIALVVCAYSIFLKLSGNRVDNSSLLFLVGMPYFFTGKILYIIAGIERIVGMFILARYHLGVFRIMRCVSREMKTDELLETDENVYPISRHANNIAIFIIIGVVIDLIGGNSLGTILSAHALYTEPIYIAFTGITAVCIIAMAFIIIKFFVVGSCALEFQGAHLGIESESEKEEQKGEESTAEKESVVNGDIGDGSD